LAVEVDLDLAEGSGGPATALVRALVVAEVDVVVCTHGDVIADVLVALGQPDGQCQKGSTWVVDRDGESGLQGRYLPPPL
ncbi:MAG: hypothetical protein ACRDZW_10920, partial [Acidimicrobiales bacterium]